MKKIIMPIMGVLVMFIFLPIFYAACDKTKGESIPTAPTSVTGTVPSTVSTGGGSNATNTASGTGTSASSNADFISLTTRGAGFTITKNGSLNITAAVTNISGTAKVGVDVYFSIDDSSIGSLTPLQRGSTPLATGTTDSAGHTTVTVYGGAVPGKVILSASTANATGAAQLALFMSWITINPATFSFSFFNSAANTNDGPCVGNTLITRYYVTGNSGAVSWTNVRTDLGGLSTVVAGDDTRMDYITTSACSALKGFGDTVYVTDDSGNMATSTLTVNALVNP